MTTEARFGSNVIKRSKKKHCIERYIVREDFIECVCGFTGTEAEFDVHMGRFPNRPKYLDYLSEMMVYRNDYPTNGTLMSHRSVEGYDG